MAFASSDFAGVRLMRLIGFCRRVNAIEQTPELIRLVARQTEYLAFCRKIADPDRKFQTRFAAMCRTNCIDPDAVRKRMRLVASVFKVYHAVDYYQILGVPPDADAQAIKQAYRKKAQILHPDKAAGDDKDGVRFAELNEAYVHLSDPEERDFYDRMRMGADSWIERGATQQRPAAGARVGRCLGWLLVGVGILVVVVYAFDVYRDERFTRFAGSVPGDRFDERYPVPTPPPDPLPDSSAAGNDFTALQGEVVESVEADAAATIPPEEEAASQSSALPAPKVQPMKKTMVPDAAMHAGQEKSSALRTGVNAYRKAAVIHTRRTTKMPAAKINGFKPIKNDAVDYAAQKRRVTAFLKQYTQAYEQEDLDRFQSFFATGALEQGKPFEQMLPTYRKTFRLVDALRFYIGMTSLTIDNRSKTIRVKGAFAVSYRLPAKDWGSSSGSIQLELLDTPRGFLVSRLDYQKHKGLFNIN